MHMCVVCVCLCTCVHMCGHACVHVWACAHGGPRLTLGVFLYPVHVTLWDRTSQLNPELTSMASLVRQFALGTLGLYLLRSKCWNYRRVAMPTQHFYMGFRNLYLTPHACVRSALSNKPSPQPLWLSIKLTKYQLWIPFDLAVMTQK